MPPPVIQYAPWYLIYIQQTQLYAEGLAKSLGDNHLKNVFLSPWIMNNNMTFSSHFSSQYSSTKVRRILFW